MATDAPRRRLRAVADVPRPDEGRLVDRARLLRTLAGAPGATLAVVTAPAGYGKTTLLRQWADRDERPFAWIDVAERHNDPLALLDAVAGADVAARSVLVVDDAHRLRAPEAIAALGGVLEHLGPDGLLVLSTRAASPLPLGRLRTEDRVVELSAGQLAMTAPEATLLLRRAGLRLKAEQVATLVARTEGWPAGLHLAALSLRDEEDLAGAIARFGGDDRIVADYLRDEVLAALAPADREFLRRTSPLDVLSAPACDALLERHDSGRVLRRIARSASMVLPADRVDEAFRCHPLLRDLLLRELEVTDPATAAALHTRASLWCEERGDRDAALDHAIAAGDAARAGDLLWDAAADGRTAEVHAWLGRFREPRLRAEPALALSAAAAGMLDGERDDAERWTRAAQPALTSSSRSRRKTLAARSAILRAAVARDGVTRMGDEAWSAYALDAENGPWRAFACLLAGTARHLTGDAGAARRLLEEGARRGAVRAVPAGALCLAQLALLALDDDDDAAEAGALTARARERVGVAGLEDLPACALVFAASGVARSRLGAVDEAARDAARARGLLARLPDPAPWYAAETCVALARTDLRLSDAASARTLLGAATRALRHAPDATLLQRWIDDAWGWADAFAASSVAGPAALTTAELRVLRFLPSHLSFREIALRLHVSANTVKTQAHAVYRKLDATSRSEAVRRAREVGLVEG